MVATGPTPGSTPMAVPMTAPIRHQKRLMGIGTWVPKITTHLRAKQAEKPIHRSEGSAPQSIVPLPTSPQDRIEDGRQIARPRPDRHSQQPDEQGPGRHDHDDSKDGELEPPGLVRAQ